MALLLIQRRQRRGVVKIALTRALVVRDRMTASFDDSVFCDWVQRILTRRIRYRNAKKTGARNRGVAGLESPGCLQFGEKIVRAVSDLRRHGVLRCAQDDSFF